jgi:hypothetical protein
MIPLIVGHCVNDIRDGEYIMKSSLAERLFKNSFVTACPDTVIFIKHDIPAKLLAKPF